MAVDVAFILCAGLGTRLKPFTNHHPKALAPVHGKSLLQRNIQFLQSFGIKQVVINVHHFADQIKAAVEQNNGWGSQVFISDETEQVLETGGGIVYAKPLLEQHSSFLVMNVDILTNINLHNLIAAHHNNNNALATLAVTNRQSSRQFLVNHNGLLKGWQNNQTGEQKIPQATTEALTPVAFSGIHVLRSNIYNFITQQGKFSIIDTYLSLCAQHSIATYNHSGDILMDVGKPESITKAEEIFKD
jgi:N-acetyl-alpha-D-muramate 1-phosphate uridylyltransferase